MAISWIFDDDVVDFHRRSRPFSHGNSSVNIVTQCRYEHGQSSPTAAVLDKLAAGSGAGRRVAYG